MRVRVTALAAIAVLAVLLVAGALLVARQRAALVDQLDRGLRADAQRIAATIESSGQLPAVDDDDERVVLVVSAGGDVVATSGDLDDGDDLALRADGAGQVTVDGEGYRVASREVDLASGDDALVYVAGSVEDVEDSVGDLIVSLAWIFPAATLLLALVVWMVVGRTLRPVERIRAEVASIGLRDLDRRVPQPPGDDEIARLATTMNEMLARLERSAERQQRFTADASHELRTPLARMRAELEVDERDPQHADVEATRRSQLEEIDALQRMIEDLLLLARGDATAAARPREPVDLDDIVLDEARAERATGVPVDVSAVSAAQVLGDPGALRRVVRNLLDNAQRHAKSRVTVTLAEHDHTAILTVADDGPGVPAERRAEVFERFSRLDEARSGGPGRSGLGLAIVHDVVGNHGGAVVVDDAALGGARFTVTMPTPPAHRRDER